MKKSYLSTVLLTTVFAFLAAWYFLYEQKYSVEKKEADEKGKLLFSLAQKDIKFIDAEKLKNPPAEGTFTSENAPELEHIRLTRSGEEWTLLEPIKDKGDKPTVDTVLNALFAIKWERVVDDKPKGLDQYVLKYPHIKIKVRVDEKSPGQEISIGAHTPVGQSSYAMMTGNTAVYRIPRWIRATVEKGGKDYRNKTMVDVAKNDIEEFEIQLKSENIVFKKEATKDTWVLARENIPGDTEEVTKSVNGFVDMKTLDFPDYKKRPLSEFNLAHPDAKVTITTKDKKKASFILGRAKTGKVYAKKDGVETVYEVVVEPLTSLQRPAAVYRSTHLAKFDRFRVNRIKIEKGAQPLELVKSGSKWTITGDALGSVDATRVEDFLGKLQDIRLTKYGKKGQKVTNPVLVIHLFEGEPGKEKEPKGVEKLTLSFAKEADKEHLVERSDMSVPFSIKTESFATINLDKMGFIATAQQPAPAAPKKPGKS